MTNGRWDLGCLPILLAVMFLPSATLLMVDRALASDDGHPLMTVTAGPVLCFAVLGSGVSRYGANHEISRRNEGGNLLFSSDR
jgi:hypothetical protein